MVLLRRGAGWVLTGRVEPNEGSIILLNGHELPVLQHVHVRARADNARRHAALLALRHDEVGHPALRIIVSPMILVIPTAILDRIIGRGIHIMLQLVVPSDLVRAHTIERLRFLADREPIGIDPGAPAALEGAVQVLLVVLRALDASDIWQLGDLLCAAGAWVPGEDAGGVAAAF